jgi:hypothetical protein
MTCSMNALRRAGIVPCHSGKKMTRCCPETIAFCAATRPSGR